MNRWGSPLNCGLFKNALPEWGLFVPLLCPRPNGHFFVLGEVRNRMVWALLAIRQRQKTDGVNRIQKKGPHNARLTEGGRLGKVVCSANVSQRQVVSLKIASVFSEK